MIELLRKALAFVKRDFRIESGYQASFIIRVVESIMLLVVFHFLGELITPRGSASLSRYGGRYFSFVIVGLAFARYFDLTLRMFSESIRLAQVTGCL
jgi:ABC-2 type transport system permease protein